MNDTLQDKGKEPGNWELYRGIERVEATLQEIVKSSVSAAVFAVEKQALHNRIDGSLHETSILRAELVKERGDLEAYAKEQDAQRGRNRLFVYGIIAAPVVAYLLSLFVGSFS